MSRFADGPGGSPPLYVITLTSSTAPMPLQGPSAPELTGLALFRSRRIEDGRERYRLHLGYFSTAELAEEALPLVRDAFPAAFVGIAPETNMGSLDDTAIARFTVLRPAVPEPVPEPPAATLATPRPRPRVVPPATPAPRPASPALAAARAATPQPRTPPPPVVNEPEPEPEPEKTTQQYAVQLLWSAEPIDLGKLPALSIFGGYLLYAVETEQGERRRYGVRLGFYVDALSAGLVAQTVRPQFKDAAVVPVSDREHARASTAVIRLASLRAGRGSGLRVRWPQSAIPVDFVPNMRARKSASPLRK